MTAKRSPLSRWIFEEYTVSDRSLAIARVLFAVLLLVFWYDPDNPLYLWMSRYPGSFYAPPIGLGIFLSQQPPAVVMWLLMFAVMTLTIALLVGWRTRIVGLTLAAALLIGNSFEYSFGKINHDIVRIAVLLVMSFSGWERAFSVDAHRRRFRDQAPRWPLALLALLLSLAMLSAGLPKLMSGWLDLSTQSAKGHLISNLFTTERPTLAGDAMLSHMPNWAWEGLDWSTIGIEMGFLLAMFSQPAMRVICAIAVFFHAGIQSSMDIFFIENLMAYAMFVEWERGLEVHAFRLLAHWYNRGIRRVRGWMLPLAGLCATTLYATRGNPAVLLLNAFGDGRRIRDSIAAIAATVFASAFLGWYLYGTVRRAAGGSGREEGVSSTEAPLILFDGVCGLCNRFVDFVIARDKSNRFRFAALQSAPGQAALRRHGLPAGYVDSIVLVSGGSAYRYSRAVLHVLGGLGWPWSATYVLILVPPPLRDLVYDFIASNRFNWFGRREWCRMPTLEERAKFLS